METEELLNSTIVDDISDMDLEPIGCGNFRVTFRILDDRSGNNFKGDVIKIPKDGYPGSKEANKLEMKSYRTASPELMGHMAESKKLRNDGCLIMEYVQPIPPNSKIPKDIQELFYKNISEVPLITQTKLDLRAENFGRKNGKLLLYDYPFGEI